MLTNRRGARDGAGTRARRQVKKSQGGTGAKRRARASRPRARVGGFSARLRPCSSGAREVVHLDDHPVDEPLAVTVAVREAARLIGDLVPDDRLPLLVFHYLDGRLTVLPAPGHLVDAQHQAPGIVQGDLVRVPDHPPLGPQLVDGVADPFLRVAAVVVHELEEWLEVLDGAHDEAPVRVPVGPLRHRVARSLLPVTTRCPRQHPVVCEILHLLVDGRAPLLPRGVIAEVPIHFNGEAGRLRAHHERHLGAPAGPYDLPVLVPDERLVAPTQDHVATVDHDRHGIGILLHLLLDPLQHEAVLGTVKLPRRTCARVRDHGVAVLSRAPARKPHRVTGACLHGDDADVPDVADSSPVTSQPALVIDAAVQREVLVLEALHREPVT
mmetsp:Transcript_44820/g.128405  ORF Transcript_44820/g.128405 Transcript_44820/m.128405 type:complete len:383 (+) Transcript_44820:59-1207(+)